MFGPSTDTLLPLVYEDLRRLAEARLAQEMPGQTLQATALVHEVYLRLKGAGLPSRWENKGHSFAAAAEAMRRILVERARAKKCLMRGGGRKRLSIDQVVAALDTPPGELLELNDALDALAAEDPQGAELVKLRYFAGLTLDSAADSLGIRHRSADRLWAYARAWLFERLSEDQGEGESRPASLEIPSPDGASDGPNSHDS
jgi:RNA polymerase sigma factor (TIGR02999 family)